MKKKLTRQQNIIAMAQKLGVAGKHAGSKPVSRLLNSIRSYQRASQIHQNMILKRAAKAKNQPAAPESLAQNNVAENVEAVVVENVENVVETVATENVETVATETAENVETAE